MPGNIISINDWAEFYVGDSKMSKLVKWLGRYGLPENKEAKEFLEAEKVECPTSCSLCHGSGIGWESKDGESVTCYQCGGTGK